MIFYNIFFGWLRSRPRIAPRAKPGQTLAPPVGVHTYVSLRLHCISLVFVFDSVEVQTANSTTKSVSIACSLELWRSLASNQ
jgi:hypothetical protein